MNRYPGNATHEISRRTVLFLGGNGHCAARLNAARLALGRRREGLDLVDVSYPGFEDRPRARSRAEFLAELARSCRRAPSDSVVMATGIGALLALSLRAHDELPQPLILQGPVLWGLEQRVVPRLMRWQKARDLLKYTIMQPWIQALWVRRYLCRPIAGSARTEFFDGYARCAAFGDLFAWFTPVWLRELEQRFASRPDALGRITVWIGGRDRVVGRADVCAAECALHVNWPAVEYPSWGHYPMIDVPEEWAEALTDAVAAA